MKSIVLRWMATAMWCALLSTIGPTPTSAQTPPSGTAPQAESKSPPAKKPVDPAKLAERERYADDAIRLKKEGKPAEAVATLRKALAVHLEIAPEDIQSSLGMLGWMVDIAAENDDLATVESLLGQAHELSVQRFGANDWRTIDNRLQWELVRTHRTLSAAERAELIQAQELAQEAGRLGSEGKFREAVTVAERVVAIKKRILGVKHSQYAAGLMNLAQAHAKTGAFAQAMPLFLEADAILKAALGAKHPKYAASVSSRAAVYIMTGAHAEAEPLFAEARAILKDAYGTKHELYATNLANSASLYTNMGDFVRAEALSVEATAIWKELVGPKHPDYATSLNGLAAIYKYLGDNARAERLFVEAHTIWKQIVDRKHPSYALSLSNLAWFYDSMGDYARSAPLNAEALAIRKEVLGTKHPEYASSLHNLGRTYVSMGDYARAEALYNEALANLKENVGTKHPDYTTALNGLALVYDGKGDKVGAEKLCLEALAIQKETLGPKHPDYAMTLNNLAAFYMRRGENRKAVPLFIEAASIHKETFGPRHSRYATNLNNLATVYEKLGQYDRAEALHLEGLAIQKESLGVKHPEYAVNLSNLAMLYTRVGNFERAEQAYREALDVFRASLDATASVQSERQQLTMSETVRSQLDAYVAIGANSGKYSRSIFDQVLAWKGSTLVRQRAMRSAARDPAIAETFGQLQTVAGQLASLGRAVPPTEEQRVGWRTRITELTLEKERLEAELSSKSAAFRRGTKAVTVAELSAALPKNAVLLDYLEYTGLSAMPQMRMLSISHPQLAVFVVRPTANGDTEVTLIPLGSIDSISDAIDIWREKLGVGPDAEEASATLRQLIWEPIEKHLAGAETILVSTDGALGRLPLGALPGKAPGTYLLEDHRLAMIPVPRLLPELVAPTTDERKPAYELLLFGDVDYDAESDALQGSAVGSVASASSSRAPRGDGTRYGPLPGTKDEVGAIAALFGGSSNGRILSLTAAEATETSFREVAPRCRMLHLATHGFFAPENVRAMTSSQPATRPTAGTQQTQVIGYSANLLSGLALAGANRPPRETGDDGILTADEIAALPLDGTRLVTLSACETGLGLTAGGEGLLGLQRAFQVSGARTTIASYWKVDDLVTRVLMERFYKNLATSTAEKPIGMLDALREAQLWVLRNPQEVAAATTRGPGAAKPLPNGGVPAARPTSTTARSPIRHWAAFSLSGDWR